MKVDLPSIKNRENANIALKLTFISEKQKIRKMNKIFHIRFMCNYIRKSY